MSNAQPPKPTPNVTPKAPQSAKTASPGKSPGRAVRNAHGKRLAAVLVPIWQRMPVPTLIYTQRSSDLLSHPGQISFPGGCVEPQDADLAATALREAHEEIGLDPNCVQVVTLLPEIETPTGFAITPVVGLVDPAARLIPNHREVAAIFEVPLPFLLTLHHQYMLGESPETGLTRMFEFAWESWRIWGATARISLNLIENLMNFFPQSGDLGPINVKNPNFQQWSQLALTSLATYQPKKDET
ncbi:MAG: CoA pyrophosphatase [Candidatus Symbiobacter sp.]|nr:CoA pyrophosphatase [Candidatus Symbiobacter sp.]